MRVSQKNLEDNLIEKKILIEKLKELLITDGSINSKYNEFKKIQNSWIKTGQVPRSQNVIIWNNYQHHIKNFYDYLHLNRKFKEIDLDHNLKDMYSGNCWGVPSFKITDSNDENPFYVWGQDRMWLLKEEIFKRMKS